MRRTPLRPGKPLQRKQGIKRGKGLKPGKPIKRGKDLRKVNPDRKAKRSEQKYGPGGGGGDYAVILRAHPCAPCGKGRPVPRAWREDIEKLRLSQQSECSHVIHGPGARWWHQVPSCSECHTTGPHAVHGINSPGWGECKEDALNLARALAWVAVDHGVVDPDNEPDCERPPEPASYYLDRLRAAWLRSRQPRTHLLTSST